MTLRSRWVWLGESCIGIVSSSLVALGCGAEEPSGGVAFSCSAHVERCDVHSAQCRQLIFDKIGCMRGHTTRTTPPPVHFVQLRQLIDELQQAEAKAPDLDAEATRRGLSLLGLVATKDIDAQEAVAERLEGLAALYIPETKQVVMIEDGDADDASESPSGLPADVFGMSVLAHEYVHAYQDREYDLQKFQRRMPSNFDGQLASISAVEGEAALYEYEFLFDVLDRTAVDRRGVFEALVDAAEEALRTSDSPWLAARGIFPYTYGAHSAWALESEGGAEALEGLRSSKTTLSYIERRFGALERDDPTPIPSSADADAGSALQKVVDDDLGAWLLNAFVSRALELPQAAALHAARQWSSDQLSVWRGNDDEVLVHWAIGLSPARDLGDAPSEEVFSFAGQRETLANLAPPVNGSAWRLSLEPDRLVITASTEADSDAVDTLHRAHRLGRVDVDAGDADGGATDAGLPLASFGYQQVPPESRSAHGRFGSVRQVAQEQKLRSRALRKLSPLLKPPH